MVLAAVVPILKWTQVFGPLVKRGSNTSTKDALFFRGLRDRCQTPRRVRRQLQVNEGGLDAAVSQPQAQVVQRNSVEQHVPGKAVPQRVGPNTSPPGGLAGLSGPKDRLLHPLPDRDPGHIDQPALANCPGTGGCGQGRLQLRMDRDHPGLASLALPDDQRGSVRVQVQVPGFQGQGFGHPEARPPLFQQDKPGPWVGRRR